MPRKTIAGTAPRPIEVGVHGRGLPPVDLALLAACRSEKAGYDAIWWSDHFLHWFPPGVWTPDIVPLASHLPSPHAFLDPTAVIAAAAVQTERIRLGTCVTDAIRHHPAVLARTFLTLDHLSKGRAMLGIGVGEAENTLPFGLPYERTASRMIEAVEIVRLLWSTSEPVDFEGDFWKLDRALLGMRPYGEHPPEIWIAAHRSRVLRATGRLADGWIPMILDPEEYGRRLGVVRRAAADAGRRPDELRAGLFIWVVVDESREAAARMLDSLLLRLIALTAPEEEYAAAGAEPPTAGGWGLLHFVPTHMFRKRALSAASAVPQRVLRRYYFHGTPDDIVERLRPFREAGLEHVYLVNVTGLADPARASASAALTQDVMRGLRSLSAG